jgi:hypothetical protein
MKTISIECVHCHKRYNAPAAMAGKKVKCKHCTKVFAIPLDGAQPGDAGLSTAGDEVAESGAPIGGSRGGTAVGAKVNSGSRGGGKLGQAGAGIGSRMARREDADEIAIAEPRGAGGMLRPSVPFDFPGAGPIDQLAPLLLTVLGLAWLAHTAIQTNMTGQGWVGFVRVGAYLALALGVAFPLGYWAVSYAAQKCRFMMPPAAPLRALGAFTLAFAVTFVFWLGSGTAGMLIFGAIVGLVLACAAVWFLFRVQTHEMSTVLGGSVAAFVGAVLISYFVLFGVNLVFAKVAEKGGANQLAMSPMGPFAWDVPVVDPNAGKGQPKTSVAVAIPDTQPTTPDGGDTGTGTISTTQQSTTRTTVATTQDAATRPANPGDPGTAIALAVPGTNDPKMTEPKGTDPAATVVKPTPPDVGTPVKPGNPGGIAVTPPPAPVSNSPLVEKLIPVADLGDCNYVVFSGGPGNVVAAVKVGPTEEAVEFFAGNPLVKRGENIFPVEKDVQQNYVLSASGETLARMVSWPKLGVQLWSTSANKELKTVPLKPENGTPELVGFGANDSLVIVWKGTRAKQDVEVINAKGAQPQALAFFVIDTVERAPGNPSISPDGRQLALAANAPDKAGVMRGGVDLWNLTTTARTPPPLRTLDVPLTTWVKPTGMAYGPAGATLAAYFEQDGRGVVYAYRTADVKPRELLFRAPPYPAGAGEGFVGRTFDWVDANTWLLMGRALIDADTGKVLGDLGVENVRAQRVVDKDTLLLQTQGADGRAGLVQVKLNAQAVGEKRAEARGGKPLNK